MLKLVNPLLMTFATGFATIAPIFVIQRINACAGTGTTAAAPARGANTP